MAVTTITQYDGRVLAGGPHVDHREGDLRSVVMHIESDRMEAAKTFNESDEYNAGKAMRDMAAQTDP